MLYRLKHLLIGSPLPTYAIAEKRLNKIRALAAFSPDAISSIAYANQEIYLGLVVAGSMGLLLALPIGIAITCLLIIVALSYFQLIHGYPTGGGSYSVARQNLGTLPGLTAAAALLVDYLLTAAVSLTAGVDALASAFPTLWEHRVPIQLLILVVLTLVNLRGLRETGTLLAIPVYLFLVAYLAMLAVGIVRLLIEGPESYQTTAPGALQPLSLILILRAFSSGSTALTGIEAISNGIPAFRPPESKNAGRTHLVMTVLMGILFLGSIGLTHGFALVASPQETILSALARRILGRGALYFAIQISTLLLLAVAANTSFASFPHVTAILAADGYLPRQLTNLGDRLVYTNGILSLSLGTGALLFLFGGDTHALIPLFAVGAFLAFTLSQAGMVVHWFQERGRNWQLKALVNSLGALITGMTTLIMGVSKFIHGAWIAILLIPLIVLVLLQINRHYQLVRKQLSLRGLPPSLKPAPPPRVVIPISGVHRGIIDAVDFAQAISKDISAFYVELEPGAGDKIVEQWKRWWPDIPIYVKYSPYRSIIAPLLEFLDETDQRHNDGQLATVILPEFIPAKWWHGFLHNQTSWLIKTALLYRRRAHGYQRVIIDIPYHLRK